MLTGHRAAHSHLQVDEMKNFGMNSGQMLHADVNAFILCVYIPLKAHTSSSNLHFSVIKVHTLFFLSISLPVTVIMCDYCSFSVGFCSHICCSLRCFPEKKGWCHIFLIACELLVTHGIILQILRGHLRNQAHTLCSFFIRVFLDQLKFKYNIIKKLK